MQRLSAEITIGVFDSGIGGKSVEAAIKKALPDVETIYVEDSANLPYGSKTPRELLELVTPILQTLAENCDIIVIACNSVTTTIIQDLREIIGVPLVGVEPMVKPAASLSKTGTIAVCATPATLASRRYAWLKKTYANNINVLEPDCSDWAAMIERNQVDEQKVASRLQEVLNEGADVIVLGCTHYHWIQEPIERITAGRAHVIQPETAITKRLQTVINRLELKANKFT